MARNFSRQQVLEAIKGSGGIISTVAKRLGCEWHTARTYIRRWASTRIALEAEDEGILDLAESVLLKNIQLASKLQAGGELVDTKDAKYVLSTKGKGRGYTERMEVEGGETTIVNVFSGNVGDDDV